ncbi:hypothetical protein NCS56_00990200 [Fusarium sp. Ph1]|nr:hypothetical protein NCS56_00990200 [Fusarium sp. Ph1]
MLLTVSLISSLLLFASAKDVGGAGNLTVAFFTNDQEELSGVNWLLQNRDGFDSKANYSQIRSELLNKTTEDESGEVSAWSLYVYAFSNCQQITDGDNVDADDFPWFESTCQTEKGGECQGVLYPIKSFAIVSTNKEEGCEAWAKQGSAARVGGRVLPLVSTLVTVAALVLVL